jgi:hypothetical protein
MIDGPTTLDTSALPLWYVGHKQAIEALHKTHACIVKALVARKHAGLTGEPDGAATKRANVDFGAAVAALAATPAEPAVDPDAPFLREPGSDDADEDWYASPRSIRDYFAGKGSRREVERSVRAHAPRMSPVARAFLSGAAVDRLTAIALARPDSDGTAPTTETLRRDVEQWAAEGPAKG